MAIITEPDHHMLHQSTPLAHLDSSTSKVWHVSSLAITAEIPATVVARGTFSTRPSSAIHSGAVK